MTSLLSSASWQDNSRISFCAYLWSPYELSDISAAMTYIPNSIKVILALGHWAFWSFYGTRCSQICLSDRQTIAFQYAKPNAQSNLYQIRYFFCVAAILETFRFKDEDDYEYEIWLKVFFAYSQNIDSPESFILRFFTRKVSNCYLYWGGRTCL